MKKKLFRFGLILCLLFSIAASASAAEVLDSGTYGENITWAIYDDATLVFSGTGATEDNTSWRVPDYLATIHPIKSVVIEEGITGLGDYMFPDTMAAEGIRFLTLPTTLRKTGDHCFTGTTNLQQVHISSLEKWNQIEFVNWSNPLGSGAALYVNGSPLKHLVIPESITCVNISAFQGCTSLNSVVLHSGVTEIGAYAFNSCPNLKKLIFLGDYPTFGHAVFVQTDPAIIFPADNPTWPADLPFSEIPEIFWNPRDHIQWLPTDPSKIFADVPTGSWFEPAVDWALSWGITNGVGNFSFGPNDPCTRGQVVTFLWRAVGSPEPSSAANPFVDVAETSYYYKAVLWAVEIGITNGMSDTTFVPEQPCTRAQVATFLWRAARKPAAASGEHRFTDIEAAYYYDAVLWAVEQGITNGTSETTFEPAATCTRAQIVTFLYRFLSGENQAP